MADTAPRAVVFDVGRVLVQWQLRALFEKLYADRAELAFVLDRVVTEQWHHQQDEGRPLAEMVAERLREFPDHAAALEAYATRFAESIPGPVPGTHELVARLRARGVPLFALTNFGADFWDDFHRRERVFDGFVDIVVSGHEKCAKPDPRIYEIAERRFALPPGALLFVDDKPENIAAARARGWHGHLFTDAIALEAELVRAGLLG